MTKTKVVHFIETLYQGGAETLVKDYALLLDKSKFDITILCLRRTYSPYETLLKNAGIKVIFISDFFGSKKTVWGRIKNKISNIVGLYHIKVKKILNEINPDVIHAHLAVLRYLVYALSQISPSLFYTVHNEPQKYWHCKTRISSKEFKACQYLVQEKKMRLISLHSAMQKELDKLFCVDNTIVVNNGIDFSKFSKALSKEEIRKKLQISQESFVIGHIGRFVEQKNHRFLIETFYHVLKQKENSTLLLIGTGPLLDEIKKQIHELKIDNHVIILSNRSDIPDLMNAMDVFAFPSLWEGLGIVLIEAQKMQTRCVISSAVPDAAIVSNLVYRMPKNASANEWAEILLNFKVNSVQYDGLENWDMGNVIRTLENLYTIGKS
jgi:glycosyltransferase involved in cell wall biosynthesis